MTTGERLRIAAREHAGFLALVAVAAALRGTLLAAYRPALFLSGDSYSYLRNAMIFEPDPQRPFGYSLFLRALVLPAHELVLVPVLQHVVGLAIGVTLYVLLLRLGVPRWLATIATVPVLLDMLQVTVEHYILTETLFQALVLGALVLLVWRDRPGWAETGAAGLLLAAATLTRTVGIVLVLPALAFVLVRRLGAVRSAALAVAFAAPLVGYAAWFDSFYGKVRLYNWDGYFLYGRVAPFADCDGLTLTPAEHQLCPAESPRYRPTWYVYYVDSPIQDVKPPPGDDVNEVAARFARRIIVHQPTDYARAVGGDFLEYFQPLRRTGSLDDDLAETELQTDRVSFVDSPRAEKMIRDVEQDPNARSHVVRPLASGLVRWQRFAYVPGPVLGLALLLGVFGGFAGNRRGESLLFASVAALLLLVPVAAVVFDYRHLTPALPFLGGAGALGGTALKLRVAAVRQRARGAR